MVGCEKRVGVVACYHNGMGSLNITPHCQSVLCCYQLLFGLDIFLLSKGHHISSRQGASYFFSARGMGLVSKVFGYPSRRRTAHGATPEASATTSKGFWNSEVLRTGVLLSKNKGFWNSGVLRTGVIVKEQGFLELRGFEDRRYCQTESFRWMKASNGLLSMPTWHPAPVKSTESVSLRHGPRRNF